MANVDLKPTRRKRFPIAVSVSILFAVSVAIAATGRHFLYHHSECSHEAELKGLRRYAAEIDHSALAEPENWLLTEAIAGSLVGQPIDNVKAVLANARFKSATEHGATFQYSIPCNYKTVSRHSELWLVVLVDYRCNHVTSCYLYDGSLF